MTLKICDFAKCAKMADSSIRYFGSLGLLGPVIRNPDNNYRLFDLRQVPYMHLLTMLRELGFSLKQLQDFGRSRTPESALELYRECDERLDSEIEALRARKQMLRNYVSLIWEGQAAKPDEINLRRLAARHVRFVPIKQEEIEKSWNELACETFEQVSLSGNAGCPLGYAYHSFFDCLEKPDQPAQLVSYDLQGPDLRPAGEYLVGTVSCGYGETGGLPRRMFGYALNNNLELCGPAYMIYLLDAASVAGPEQYLLQITAAVKPA